MLFAGTAGRVMLTITGAANWREKILNPVNISVNATKAFAHLPGLKNGTHNEKKTDSQEKFKVTVRRSVIFADVTSNLIAGTDLVNSRWLCHRSSDLWGKGKFKFLLFPVKSKGKFYILSSHSCCGRNCSFYLFCKIEFSSISEICKLLCKWWPTYFCN